MSTEVKAFFMFPWLVVGNQICSVDVSFVQTHSVTHIVNCASNQCSSALSGVLYHNIPIEDDGFMAISPFIYQAVNFIKDAKRTPAGVILIHCELGRSRSVSILLAYLILEENMSFREAWNKVTALSAYACPNPVFKQDLIRCWEAKQIAGGAMVSLLKYFPGANYTSWEECRSMKINCNVEDIGYTASGRWGNAAAGVLIINQSGDKVLLLKRSADVEEPGLWSIPGGAMKVGESALQTAITELREEAGHPAHASILSTPIVFDEDGYQYSTFLLQLPYADEAFSPRLNWEHDAWRWFSLVEVLYNSDVHRGVKFVIDALLEKDVACGAFTHEGSN